MRSLWTREKCGRHIYSTWLTRPLNLLPFWSGWNIIFLCDSIDSRSKNSWRIPRCLMIDTYFPLLRNIWKRDFILLKQLIFLTQAMNFFNPTLPGQGHCCPRVMLEPSNLVGSLKIMLKTMGGSLSLFRSFFLITQKIIKQLLWNFLTINRYLFDNLRQLHSLCV